MENLAAEKALEIIARPLESALDEHQVAEIDRIVELAEGHMEKP